MRHYSTLFDSNYLPNFLALYHSLYKQDEGIEIYAFCMDDFSYDFLSRYANVLQGQVKCISLLELIEKFPVLSKIKQERSLVEFYFTCSSFITYFVMQKEILCTHITYLDADLFFFDSPEKIFHELGDASVGIIAHNFFGRGRRYLKYGIYNVGWVTFKNDKEGKRCLRAWKNDCEEWCFDYFDEQMNRFGDQKYLDSWEGKFAGVKVIKQKGANLAPWNVGQYDIKISDLGKLFVDRDPLVFYHFASFKAVDQFLYTTSTSMYFSRPTKILKEKIYQPYLISILNFATIINKNNDKFNLLKKRRGDFNKSPKKKINNLFISLVRWYFSDYITIKNR